MIGAQVCSVTRSWSSRVDAYSLRLDKYTPVVACTDDVVCAVEMHTTQPKCHTLRGWRIFLRILGCRYWLESVTQAPWFNGPPAGERNAVHIGFIRSCTEHCSQTCRHIIASTGQTQHHGREVRIQQLLRALSKVCLSSGKSRFVSLAVLGPNTNVLGANSLNGADVHLSPNNRLRMLCLFSG